MTEKFLNWTAEGLGFIDPQYSWRPHSFRELDTTARYWFFAALIAVGLLGLAFFALISFIIIGICIVAPVVPVVLAIIFAVPGALVYFTRDKKNANPPTK